MVLNQTVRDLDVVADFLAHLHAFGRSMSGGRRSARAYIVFFSAKNLNHLVFREGLRRDEEIRWLFGVDRTHKKSLDDTGPKRGEVIGR